MKNGMVQLSAALWVVAWLAPVGCQWDWDNKWDWDREPAVLTVDVSHAVEKSEAVLRAAAEDEDPFTRAHAMEALGQTLAQGAGDLYVKALDDPEPSVRFAAAMAIGDSQYAPAKPHLVELMEDPATRDVFQCALIYALHRLGETGYNRKLGVFLWEPDKRLRANTALVMGKIGHPSAIEPLKKLLVDEQDPMVEVNIIESLASLGDVAAGMRLQGYCRTPYVDQQLLAIRALARLRPEGAEQELSDKLKDSDWPRIRVAAAGGLGRMGQATSEAYAYCIKALQQPGELLAKAYPEATIPESHVASLQQMAAVALGWLGQDIAINDLYPLLDSPRGPVRVASAMSILLLAPEGELPHADADADADGPDSSD
ncbi:hypothetical protein LCGC14_0284790 [marine sediment metagenome]|uniref:HEAT repeat domain-containing protein n=1 Tax=marine sediment metagenome TaxID=412755 RepID=A0A0F9TUX8_9ZZZZ